MCLPPWSFTRYTDAPPEAIDGFALDSSGKHFRVVLAKRSVEDEMLTTCVFLWRLPDGHAQCGLGDLRPSVCQSYPSALVNGILCLGDSQGCSCRTWSLAHVDVEHESELVQTLEHERAEYSEVVRQWNERVDKAGEARPYSYIEFCNYLVNVYADRYGESRPV